MPKRRPLPPSAVTWIATASLPSSCPAPTGEMRTLPLTDAATQSPSGDGSTGRCRPRLGAGGSDGFGGGGGGGSAPSGASATSPDAMRITFHTLPWRNQSCPPATSQRTSRATLRAPPSRHCDCTCAARAAPGSCSYGVQSAVARCGEMHARSAATAQPSGHRETTAMVHRRPAPADGGRAAWTGVPVTNGRSWSAGTA